MRVNFTPDIVDKIVNGYFKDEEEDYECRCNVSKRCKG